MISVCRSNVERYVYGFKEHINSLLELLSDKKEKKKLLVTAVWSACLVNYDPKDTTLRKFTDAAND